VPPSPSPACQHGKSACHDEQKIQIWFFASELFSVFIVMIAWKTASKCGVLARTPLPNRFAVQKRRRFGNFKCGRQECQLVLIEALGWLVTDFMDARLKPMWRRAAPARIDELNDPG
jgi:hypothetical protein